MTNFVLALIGWVIGIMIAFALTIVFEVQPREGFINQRENALTEQQKCVLSTNVAGN